jgi:hypothetical protein
MGRLLNQMTLISLGFWPQMKAPSIVLNEACQRHPTADGFLRNLNLIGTISTLNRNMSIIILSYLGTGKLSENLLQLVGATSATSPCPAVENKLHHLISTPQK